VGWAIPPGRGVPGGSGSTGPGGPSRRRLLTGAGLFGAGAVAGGLTGYFTRSATEPSGAADISLGQQTIPFYGAHQAGIITPAQDRLAFGTMNVVPGTSRADLRDLLRVWTGAAARMTAGQLVGEEIEPGAPPVDTGEAVGSPVSRLTITIGYGPALFDDRFGLAARKPAALADLPPLPNENLDPDYTGGDLCVQACADNPLVAFHAVRNLARIGMGVVAHNWIFIAFMKNPSQFVKLQTALAGDALNEYIHHTGSAVFAVPPGLRPGQHYGDALFS
jgi:deferrochelatase/peroxidase EfeB